MAEEQKKLNVYTLGQHGINRVKSPVHVLDGELLNAQNATIRPVQGQLALTKRDGMDQFGEVAAGTLISITNIPITSNFTEDVAYCITTPEIPDGLWWRGAWSPTLGLFVLIQNGLSATVLTSPDGIEWTPRATPASFSQSYGDIVWAPSLGLFVAVGGSAGLFSQQVMTSADGITWTARSASSDRAWSSVAWSPTLGRFAAIATTGATLNGAMTSPDGVTWTARNSAFASSTKMVWAESLGLFVSVGEVSASTTQVQTSPDGITWTSRTTPAITGGWNDLVWAASLGLLVAVGLPGNHFTQNSMYSSDGINWTHGTLIENSPSLSSIAWSPEQGVFLNASGNTNPFYSTDGINWVQLDPQCDMNSVHGVIWAPELNKFLTLGQALSGSPIFALVGAEY